MKKSSKFILFGFTGVFTVAAILFATQFLKGANGTYQQEGLSIVTDQSSTDAQLWMEARYIDPATGLKYTPEKLRAIEKAVLGLPKNKATSLTWKEEGPDNIGGRTRAILVNMKNENQVWAGSVSGGLFVSSNRGSNWQKVDSYPGSKFISSMTQMNNGWIFVATGSAHDNWTGNGAYYSMDNGVTWTIVPGTATLAYITEVACSPAKNKVFMATTQGLKSWIPGAPTLEDYTLASGTSESVQVSIDGNVIVAAAGSNRTYVSIDGGATFEGRFGNGVTEVPQGSGRIEFAISPTKNSSNKYSLYAVRTASNLVGMNVSHDNGATWSQFIGSSSSPGPLDIYRGQGGYNSIVTVMPNDPTEILIGGIDIWKWKQQANNPPSGGFEKVSIWFVPPAVPVYVHADNHEMKWDAQNRLYIGNDGGISVTDNLGTTFLASNRGYNVTQFYGIAFDRFGAVMGGAQDNGTLYNDHSNNTYKEFIEVGDGDGFHCDISFFNPNVAFTSSQYGNINRTSELGVSAGSFIPDYPTNYVGFGVGTTDPSDTYFPFNTTFKLAEYFDLNSKDSVVFTPSRNILANTQIKVASTSSGDTMVHTTTAAMYYDDTVYYEPSLTENRISIKDSLNNGALVLLGNYNWTNLTSPGTNPPNINDTLLVEFANGDDSVSVGSIGSYNWYFAQHPITNKIVEIKQDTIAYNFAWDRIKVQDPFQSWFVVYISSPVSGNVGEVWGTRNALRFAAPEQNWTRIATNVRGNPFSPVDMEFSKDLNQLYISSGSRITRVSGLGSVYTSAQPDSMFLKKVGYGDGLAPTQTPTATTQTTIYGSAAGIAINPANPDDLLVFGPGSSITRSSNATSATPTFTALSLLAGANSPNVYDGIIDRDDDDLLVVGTQMGVFVSDDGGASWTYSSEGFEGTPVYQIRQSWRTFEEGNSRPGEIYIGTFGRGIWSSSSVLGLEADKSSNEPSVAKMTAFPNPTSANTSLSFKLNNAGSADIKVYSVSGKLMFSEMKSHLSAGKNIVELNVANLPKGIYIVKMVSGKQSANTKFMKM